MNDDIQARIAAGKLHLQNQIANPNQQQTSGSQQPVRPGPPPSPINVASNQQCPECGNFHPPVQYGECPMKKRTTKSGVEIDPDPFLASMRNIVVSQMQTRNVKDPKKFFAHLTVELTKIMENYVEE